MDTEWGRLEVAARVLGDAYRALTKPEEKQRVERKMLAIASRQELYDLNERFKSFLGTTGAFALPKKKALNMINIKISSDFTIQKFKYLCFIAEG